MTVEADLFTALKTLVSNRMFPDVAPLGTAKPYLTYQQVGGTAVSFLESGVVGKRNGRFQINAWANTRVEAASLSRSVEDTLVTSAPLRAYVLGAPVASYEPETLLYGTRQDFSIWFAAPCKARPSWPVPKSFAPSPPCRMVTSQPSSRSAPS